MKKIIYILSVILFLVSCDHGVEYHPNLTDAELEKFGESLKGVYPGEYRMYWEASDGTEGKDSIPDASITVSGYDSSEIDFHGFPVSLLAKLVGKNSEVGKALQKQTATLDMKASYRLHRNTETEQIELIWQPACNNFTLDVNGVPKTIEVQVTNGNTVMIFTREQLSNPMAIRNLSNLTLQVTQIRSKDEILFQDGTWVNENEFCLIRFKVAE